MNTQHTLVLLCAASLTSLAPSVRAQTLFLDDFDVNSSSMYKVNQDSDAEVIFGYNYAAVGIPSAPNSVGGTTLGVRFRANIDTVTGAQAINISPLGQSFSGDYALRFDFWINPNGPFPGGGSGSTQFGTAGIGTLGNSVQKSSGTSDGAWFAVDGEGGSGIDFRAYRGTALEGPSSTAYAATDEGATNRRNANNSYYHGVFPGGQQAPAAQQAAFPASANATENQEGALKAGTVGFGWRQVEITKIGSDVTWSIDGLRIATLSNANLPGGNIFVGHWDVFSSVTGNPEMNFSIVDNLRVVAIPEPGTMALAFLGLGGLFLLRRVRR
jgi:hypothetical protein